MLREVLDSASVLTLARYGVITLLFAAAFYKHQGRGDEVAGYPGVPQELLHSPLAPEVKQPGFHRRACNREVDNPSFPRLSRRLKQQPGIVRRLLGGGPPPPELHPAGVAGDAGPFHRPAQPLRAGEMPGEQPHPVTGRIIPAWGSGQSPCPDAPVRQTLGNVPAGAAEGAGSDGLFGMVRWVSLPSARCGGQPEAPVLAVRAAPASLGQAAPPQLHSPPCAPPLPPCHPGILHRQRA